MGYNPQKQKAPLKVLFFKWCAILCEYRTNYVEEYKTLVDNFKIYKSLFLFK